MKYENYEIMKMPKIWLWWRKGCANISTIYNNRIELNANIMLTFILICSVCVCKDTLLIRIFVLKSESVLSALLCDYGYRHHSILVMHFYSPSSLESLHKLAFTSWPVNTECFELLSVTVVQVQLVPAADRHTSSSSWSLVM